MTESNAQTNATLFSNEEANSNTVDDNIEMGNPVEVLVGEGKKFKTVEDLARGKLAADAHIARLEAENAQARNELNTRMTLEEFLDKMNAPKELNQRSELEAPNQDGGGLEKAANTVTREDIENLVASRIQAERQAAQEAQNLAVVRQTLEQTFGNQYVQKLREVATQLGVTEEFLNSTAAANPNVFLKLVGVDEQGKTSTYRPAAAPANQVNSAANTSGTGGERTKSYYDQLRKSDPKAYRNAQVEMHSQALKLGPAFFK